MSCYPFGKKTKRVLNIGTAGGWTKASTGYTFKTQTRNRVNRLSWDWTWPQEVLKDQILVYDLLLLDILDRHNDLRFSSSMFKKDSTLILNFWTKKLPTEDIQVMLNAQERLL
jgi:lycopene beta-cyclase